MALCKRIVLFSALIFLTIVSNAQLCPQQRSVILQPCSYVAGFDETGVLVDVANAEQNVTYTLTRPNGSTRSVVGQGNGGSASIAVASTSGTYKVTATRAGCSNSITLMEQWVEVDCLMDCSIWQSVSLNTLINVNLPAENGGWNFAGQYPYNSAGFQTPGKEKLFVFSTQEEGVYYLDIAATVGSASILYQEWYAGSCTRLGWIPVGSTQSGYNNKLAIGYLNAFTSYIIVIDNHRNDLEATLNFTIRKASISTPSSTNNCISLLPLGGSIPAYSPKKEFLLDQEGNLVAALDFSISQTDYGTINASYYVNNGPLRRDNGNQKYLDRSISFSGVSGSNFTIELFIPNSELMKAIQSPVEGNGDIASIETVNISRFNQTCGGTIQGNSTNLIYQFASGSLDQNSSVIKFEGNSNSSYYLHGGNALNENCQPHSGLPFKEGFNLPNALTIPSCWSEIISGSNKLTFESFNDSPSPSPFEGNRFLQWDCRNIPMGQTARLITKAVNASGFQQISVEFYWYESNFPAYSGPSYQSEGVQVQYSISANNFTNVLFIPRHNANLPANTGKWVKKTIVLPADAANQTNLAIALLFQSANGEKCALDKFAIIPSYSCQDILGLNASIVAQSFTTFNWIATTGATGYQYAVSNSSDEPLTYSTTSNLNATVASLAENTDYFIHVRPICSNGNPGGWTSIRIHTNIDCLNATPINAYTTINASFESGQGVWNFAGTYPNNSVGYATRGRERLFSFTPNVTNLYYIYVNSGNGWVDYFYKPASEGCSNTGWIGIDDFRNGGSQAIGLLEAGTTYLILADAESTEATEQNFIIQSTNYGFSYSWPSACHGTYFLPDSIPANSKKIEYIINEYGDLLAALDFSKCNSAPGWIEAKVYANQGALRKDSLGREYLNWSLSLNSSNQNLDQVKVTMFFPSDDLSQILSYTKDGIADVYGIEDLGISVGQEDCQPAASGQFIFKQQTRSNSNSESFPPYVEFYTNTFGTFYLHGGNDALLQKPSTKSICPGTSTTMTMPNQGTGYTYRWQVDQGSGFANLSNNTNYSSTTTITLQILNPPTSFTGFKYRCVATKTGSTINGDVQTLRFVSKWSGTQNVNWDNTMNWACGIVPDGNTDVLILPGASNMPVMNSNRSVRSLSVKNGASISVNPGFKLDIKGK